MFKISSRKLRRWHPLRCSSDDRGLGASDTAALMAIGLGISGRLPRWAVDMDSRI